MEPMTVNALSRHLPVDRSTIQRLIDTAELVPESVKGRGKSYSVKKVTELLLAETKDKAYKHGFDDGKQHTELLEDPEGIPAHQKPDHPHYQRWRLEREQADKLELLNAEKRGQLIPLEPIVQRDRIVASAQAQLFDSLVVRIKRKCPDISDRVLEEVTDIVARCRNELEGLINDRKAELEEALSNQDPVG